MKDFFVSFNSADKAWADWIAWMLEEAGYQVVYQPWDFRPGGNFVLEMQKAAGETRKTVVVLTDNYLKADYTQPEWAAAFAQDPRGEDRKLIPLRVAPCSPTGLLKPLIYADLVGLPADVAKAAVLTAVSDDRPKPAQQPVFPGPTASSTSPAPPYPGPLLDTGRLPIPGSKFVGREAEIARLDAAWENPTIHVLTLVAFGGVGKSALVARWMDRMAAEGWRGAVRVLDWSFYSQGSKDQNTSAERSSTTPSVSSVIPTPRPSPFTTAAPASQDSSGRSALCSSSTVSSPCNTRRAGRRSRAASRTPASPPSSRVLPRATRASAWLPPGNGSPTSPAPQARHRRSPWRN
ncbi:MAG TPA: toll/interleukin-1 receptor domain-containing protein [Thermoanaerobaculia bacterium]|nr:toll/interleukin-1 receptor domain-containing protein [Thermoanaerobaculia bacterium]